MSGEGFAGLVDRAIAAQAQQVFVDTQEAESPGAGRSEGCHYWQSLGEKLAGECLKAAIGGTPTGEAQRPERPGVAVLGALFIEPVPVETQMVVEPSSLAVKRVIQKCGIGSREGAQASGFLLQLFEEDGQDESASGVIGAITLGEVWHGEDGMLENARGIGHAREM